MVSITCFDCPWVYCFRAEGVTVQCCIWCSEKNLQSLSSFSPVGKIVTTEPKKVKKNQTCCRSEERHQYQCIAINNSKKHLENSTEQSPCHIEWNNWVSWWSRRRIRCIFLYYYCCSWGHHCFTFFLLTVFVVMIYQVTKIATSSLKFLIYLVKILC